MRVYMSFVSRSRWIVILLCACQLTIQAQGEDPQENSDVSERFNRSIERFQLFEEGSAKPIPMVPVLKWSNAANNVKKKRVGNRIVLLCAHEGNRPVASCNVFISGGRGIITHVFCSYFERPLVCELDGGVVWRPKESKLHFQPIPNSGVPQVSRARQRIQLKSLARRFNAHTSRKEASNWSEVPELRLLPHPLFEYGNNKGPVAAGAVFGFRLGGSGHSHVLLFVEAVGDNGGLHWRYSFARCNKGSLTGFLDGQKVWSVEELMAKDLRETDGFYKVQTDS